MLVGPARLLSVASDVKEILLRDVRCETPMSTDIVNYEQGRGLLATEDATAHHLPDFFRRCRTLAEFNAFKRAGFSDALACEVFIRDEFDGLLTMLERAVRDASPPFARVTDDFIAPLVELLMLRGCEREVLILTAGVSAFRQHSYDNWDGGQWAWILSVGLQPHYYAQLDQEERLDCEKSLAIVANELLSDHPAHSVFRVDIQMSKDVDTREWRKRSEGWLSGEGINNQGRVRSDNIASRAHDGLLFRSQPEIHVYGALKASGVCFAPLPVFLRGGETYQRIEPDFVVIKQGAIMVIEVDGDTVHKETPAEADQRTRIFKYAHALIERVKSSECDSPEKAKACVDRLLAAFDEWRATRRA